MVSKYAQPGRLDSQSGIEPEQSFRDDLVIRFKKNDSIKFESVMEYDKAGYVFGLPEEIELDVIEKNGTLILCEIAFSISKADVCMFERKARFYEKMYNCKVDRLLVFTVIIDPRAEKVVEELGIEINNYAMFGNVL